MEIKLEIRHLRLLAAVAETGTVTEASKRLHVTQSALSHQLRDAEDRLGAALFLRLGKKMVLTAAGETLLASTRRVLEELGNAERMIAGSNGGSRGAIRLSTECYTCYHWLPSLMKEFHKKFPGVEIQINAEVTAKAVGALLEGKLDVAISSWLPGDKKLRQLTLFEDEMLLVMSPQHRLARVDYVRPTDLAGETILIYPPRSESMLLEKIMQPAGVTPGRVIEIPLTEGLIGLAAAGTGVGMLAAWAVAPDVRSRKVVTKPVGLHGPHRTWYALTLREPASPEYLQVFLGLLKSAAPFKIAA
jgi:LysR family transcriptional regulator for metE and metH